MRITVLIFAGVLMGIGLYQIFVFAYGWLVARGVRKLQRQRTQHVTVTPVVPQFATGGPVSSLIAAKTAGQIISGIIASASVSESESESEPLEETWSPDKIEAWRIIDVHVEQGDPDGIWLGFPHPDGPTPDRVTPVRHPVGVELHAECSAPQYALALPGWSEGSNALCPDVPGEHCQSGIGYGCGFYAFKTRDQAVEMQRGNMWVGLGAVARVLLSGKVIEHDKGYRAEILEVVEVEPPIQPVSLIEDLRPLAIWPTVNPFIQPHIISGGN